MKYISKARAFRYTISYSFYISTIWFQDIYKIISLIWEKYISPMKWFYQFIRFHWHQNTCPFLFQSKLDATKQRSLQSNDVLDTQGRRDCWWVKTHFRERYGGLVIWISLLWVINANILCLSIHVPGFLTKKIRWGFLFLLVWWIRYPE